MRKRSFIIWSMISVACILISVSMGILLMHMSSPVWQETDTSQPELLILDAGHGGEDGGAVSISGVSESMINLSIVKKMDSILGFYGIPAHLLRQEDISLHSPEAKTLREKKVSDLKNRVAYIQSLEHATVISIHQNKYPSPDVRGLQSFYAPTEGSQELAQVIQSAVQDTIQKYNQKKPKQIPKEVYLMNHISCRAVLVECGFLSNREDEALLLDDSYQTKLAAILSAVWLEEQT